MGLLMAPFWHAVPPEVTRVSSVTTARTRPLREQARPLHDRVPRGSLEETVGTMGRAGPS
ncbi:hypothetical protein GCM10011374_17940 [Kocuria dechangensis]|uniref:Uncharacterized protein n=1 Tax=Kocuria dechangensis TaxID=1176249 RepID=A0A917GSL4_9MICC|nr:hypothetical protein GCM10011374_17940 [Kocuria dechangensis]